MNVDLNIDYFRAIHGSIGCNNTKEQKVTDVQRRFSNDFDSSINVVYDAFRNDISQDFIITPTKEENKCTVITRPGEILHIGDIIFWNNLHWLVIDLDFQNEIYNIGSMVRCNRTISWQNPETLEIITRWCLATKPYTSNIDGGKVLSTAAQKYNIKIAYDSETSLIDIDKRFVLEKINGNIRTYSVTSVNAMTNRYQDIEGGFIIWELTQDQASHDTDNSELMIADYIKPVVITPPSIEGSNIDGSNIIKIGGSIRTYAFDSNLDSYWNVVVPEGFHDDVLICDKGNSLTMQVNDVAELLGKTIVIQRISRKDETILHEKKVRVVDM